MQHVVLRESRSRAASARRSRAGRAALAVLAVLASLGCAMRVLAEPGPVAAPQAVPVPAAVGQVVADEGGDRVISIGARSGLALGDHVVFYVEHEESLGGTEVAITRETLAIGVVISLSAGRAKVRLGVDERAPPGTRVSRTDRPVTASLTGPPRMGDVWELEFNLRPFLAAEESGGGVLASAGFGYRFATGIHLQILLDPLGWADVKDGPRVLAAGGVVIASYDSQYFELGLGIGAQTVNSPAFGVEPGSGMTVSQVLRLGPRDGLQLSARSQVVVFHSELEFRGLVLTAQIPVQRGYWLTFGGGGGDAGAAYAEAGVRILLTGNGGPGSVFLSAGAGWATIYKSESCEESDLGFECSDAGDYGGPMMSIGSEWRW